MSDTIQEMAETLRQQLQVKVEAMKAMPAMAEVLTLHRALNGLEAAIPRSPTSLAEIFGLGAGMAPAAPHQPPMKRWEFTGKRPLEAAKLYLKLAGEPRTIQDIVTAIRDHGGDPGSPEHLKTALTRSTLEVVKVDEEMYGLVEHFPDIKRTSRWAKRRGSAANGSPESSGEEDEGEDGADGGETETQGSRIVPLPGFEEGGKEEEK